jgi:hypothetical protein
VSLQEFLPTPKFADYQAQFKDFFALSRRADGVILAQAHTLGGRNWSASVRCGVVT